MSNPDYPLNSLATGRWFKLICGASWQHLPAIRNLTLVYTLAGADCIDMAADPAVIQVAQEARRTAMVWGDIAEQMGWGYQGKPWLMVSLNDGEDPHFRKAHFDPAACPVDCPRPCERICPTQAIVWGESMVSGITGVIEERCYGCGRCWPVCPSNLIQSRSYVSTPTVILPLVMAQDIDAIEIHTQVGHEADFRRLWQVIQPWVEQLKLVAVSCPNQEDVIDYLWTLVEVMQPRPRTLVWQTDGRPMSGDIGAGTTRAAIELGSKVLGAGLPGYVQLAGGTNDQTVPQLQRRGLIGPGRSFNQCHLAGVAYGSYARVLLSPLLESLNGVTPARTLETVGSPYQSSGGCSRDSPAATSQQIEAYPELLSQAVRVARTLVSQIKSC